LYKVLLADDERMIKKSIRSLIENDLEGFSVVAEAKNGMEAKELILAHQPDILITDIRMPVWDGLELLTWMDAHALQAESIIISGYNEFEYAQRALKFGVTEYLLKPLNTHDFLSVMNRLKSRLLNRTSVSNRRKQWLLDCKLHAENMAKALWHLNDAEMNTELDRMRDDMLNAPEYEFHDIVSKYGDYLVFLEGELNAFGGSHHSFAHLSDQIAAINPKESTQLFLLFQEQMKQASVQIRESRNWQQYHLIMKDAQRFIAERYSDPRLSLDQAAAHFGISPNYFSQLLKKTTGMSFKQYLTHLRIQHAKQLLSQPFIKVYEVGHLVGMEDYTHFSKTFKKIVGCSPSEFRNIP